MIRKFFIYAFIFGKWLVYCVIFFITLCFSCITLYRLIIFDLHLKRMLTCSVISVKSVSLSDCLYSVYGSNKRVHDNSSSSSSNSGQSMVEQTGALLRHLYLFLQKSGALLLYFWRAGSHLATWEQMKRRDVAMQVKCSVCACLESIINRFQLWLLNAPLYIMTQSYCF